MLNKVREAVSADRRRYKDSEFNLDLSYVTPRIIGSLTIVHFISQAYWGHAITDLLFSQFLILG